MAIKLSENLMLDVLKKNGEIQHRIFTTDRDGNFSDHKVVTEKVLDATHGHFVCSSNIFSESTRANGTKSYLFHTTDEEKASKILEILNRQKAPSDKSAIQKLPPKV